MPQTFTRHLRLRARRRGLHEITREVADVVSSSGVPSGLCNIFVQHTSASLIISENADPTARQDLEAFIEHVTDIKLFFQTYAYSGN